MIQSTDIRIGNYLLIDNSPQQLSAICVDGNDLNADALIGYITGGAIYYEHSGSERVQPVPLTDEILQQCGFQFHDYFKLWQRMKEQVNTGAEMELDRDNTALDFSHRPILKHIAYLHHLQNLYYALERKELPVDLSFIQNLKQNANNINR